VNTDNHFYLVRKMSLNNAVDILPYYCKNVVTTAFYGIFDILRHSTAFTAIYDNLRQFTAFYLRHLHRQRKGSKARTKSRTSPTTTATTTQ
jgi:hypothetical protein